MLAVPLADFVIMPLGMLSLLLMPMGLDYPLLYLLEKSINIMVFWAEFVASMPDANIYIPNITKAALGLTIIGGLTFMLLTTKLRLIGIPVFLSSLLLLQNNDVPDLIVDSGGKLFAVKDEYGKLVLSSKRFARFVGKSWLENFGQKYPETLDEAFLPGCKKERCEIARTGRLITIGSIKGSKKGDIQINIKDDISANNESRVIDRAMLQHKGTHAFWILESEIVIKTVDEYLESRIWNKQ
jgi:competence protein ComEC